MFIKQAVEMLARAARQEESLIKKGAEHIASPQQLVSALVRVSDLVYLYPESAKIHVLGPDEGLEDFAYGHNRALDIFLTPHVAGLGAPLFQMNASSFAWAKYTLIRCGRLAMAEQVGPLLQDGIFEVRTIAEQRIALQRAPGKIGIEALEASDHLWLGRYVTESLSQQWSRLHANEEAIRQQMRQVVFKWRDHFLGYDSTGEIDQHFYEKGQLYSFSKSGYDSFPGDSVFGGYPFHLYRTVVGTLIGRMLAHVAFGQELKGMNANLSLLDLMTIFYRIDDMADDLGPLLGIESSVIEQILMVLTMSPGNRSLRTFVPGGSAAPFVQIADGMVLRSARAILDQPFFFMLKALRTLFASDWDSAVDRREGVFRNELYALFPQQEIVKVPKGVCLRDNGRVLTDIDAAMFDPRSGELGVFQLKWQDTFASSMAERASRKKNFLVPAHKWIEILSSWTAGRSPELLGQVLGLSARQAQEVRNVRIFVIGRNFAHFSALKCPMIELRGDTGRSSFES